MTESVAEASGMSLCSISATRRAAEDLCERRRVDLQPGSAGATRCAALANLRSWQLSRCLERHRAGRRSEIPSIIQSTCGRPKDGPTDPAQAAYGTIFKIIATGGHRERTALSSRHHSRRVRLRRYRAHHTISRIFTPCRPSGTGLTMGIAGTRASRSKSNWRFNPSLSPNPRKCSANMSISARGFS
jgi:hypothetical protein